LAKSLTYPNGEEGVNFLVQTISTCLFSRRGRGEGTAPCGGTTEEKDTESEGPSPTEFQRGGSDLCAFLIAAMNYYGGRVNTAAMDKITIKTPNFKGRLFLKIYM
jgi:hypothetical protein